MRTSSGEVSTDTLRHDALKAHACTQKPGKRKGQRARPRRVIPSISNTALSILPHQDRSRYCEKGLDKCTHEEPHPRLAAYFVAYLGTEKNGENERDQRAKRLLVCGMEAVVVLPIEQAGYSKGKLFVYFRLGICDL